MGTVENKHNSDFGVKYPGKLSGVPQDRFGYILWPEAASMLAVLNGDGETPIDYSVADNACATRSR